MRVRYSFSCKRTGHIENMEKQRKKYPDVADEIVKISDILLEVLDARFIQETRNEETENVINGLGKTLIYVINKCDLVDLEQKKKEMKELGLYPYVFVSCTKRIGARELRTKIKIEAKRVDLPHEEMRRVQVGIIGYPNTGKSSLINFLSGSNSARVGAEAGFTKGMQKIKLTTDILILDTPGVIPAKDYSTTNTDMVSQHAKVSARDSTKVRNPELVVARLMKEYGQIIDDYYKINSKGDSEMLIEELGRQKNFLKKGNQVDEDRTARTIIKDWQEGKIKLKN